MEIKDRTEVEPVYKVVRVEDGKFLSAFVGAREPVFRDREWEQLEYKIGTVTESPSSKGIFCYDTERNAKAYVGDAGSAKGHPCAILKAYPVSEPPKLEVVPISPGGILCKAIIPVEIVWREDVTEMPAFTMEPEPERPEPKFKVGDRVRLKEGIDKPAENFGLFWKKKEDIGIVQSVSESKLNVRFPEMDYTYGCLVSEMKLAPPEPEWIDVTKECEVDLYHSELESASLIRIRHNNLNIFEIGNEGKAWRAGGYKVETVRTAGYLCNWFKVLKKGR